MIWHYFPIGMRFPVADFSEENRRACWQIALSAVFASDATHTGLYEACETYDPIVQSPVYICIVCYEGIKQSRAAGEKLHTLDTLLTRLCLHKPFVQANSLESFGPYPILAEIDTQGVIHPCENGAGFIPTETPVPMKTSAGGKILIAPAYSDAACDAEKTSRLIGVAAAEQGFRVRRMPIANGGEGTVRALVAGTGGRYETVSCENINGDRTNMLIGVIPGPVAVIEAAETAGGLSETEGASAAERRSSFSVGMLIKKTLDLGYRKIWIGLGDPTAFDLGLGALSALGVRITDADDGTVIPCPETLSTISHIDYTGLDPRLAQTELTLLYRDASPLLAGDARKMTEARTDASADQLITREREYARFASLLKTDPSAPGSGAAGGLGAALASIGGTLVPGLEKILACIDAASALEHADYVIGNFGCDPEQLMRRHPKLKGAVCCPNAAVPSDGEIRDAFDRLGLTRAGKGVANPADP